MPSRRRLAPLAAVLLSLSLSAPALGADPAQSAPPQDVDFNRPVTDPPREPLPSMVRRSVELYNEGAAHAAAGRLREAYLAFRDAYELDGSAESLANAAVLEAKLGLPRRAAEHLARAISRLPKDRPADAEALRKRLDEVARELGTIDVRAPVLANVELDGIWQGTGVIPRTFYVDPGRHSVVVSSGGAELTRDLVLKKGDKEQIVVTEDQLRAAFAAKAGPQAPPEPAPAARSPLPWILGGAGLALAATGGIGFGVYLRGHDERVKIEAETRNLGGYCTPTPKAGFADDCRARDQEASNETTGMVLAIVGLGGAGALGLGALLAVLADSTPPAAAASAARPPDRPRLTVGVGPGSVTLQGSF